MNAPVSKCLHAPRHVQGVVKRFGVVQALRGVDFDLEPGGNSYAAR